MWINSLVLSGSLLYPQIRAGVLKTVSCVPEIHWELSARHCPGTEVLRGFQHLPKETCETVLSKKKKHMLDTAEEDELASVLSSQLGAEQYPTVNNSNYLNHYLSLLQPWASMCLLISNRCFWTGVGVKKTAPSGSGKVPGCECVYREPSNTQWSWMG